MERTLVATWLNKGVVRNPSMRGLGMATPALERGLVWVLGEIGQPISERDGVLEELLGRFVRNEFK